MERQTYFLIQCWKPFKSILSEIPKDKGSVIITGRDGMFSGGFDLKTFASGDVDLIKNMSSLGFKTLFDLYTFPRPVVAAISGHAVALRYFCSLLLRL